ncbi:MAG TPA: hypothetical protein VHM91_04780, partial [Verrucomicrobiales bacterium]|nr:hypothetical protein [Verrucomicrobiales bacterium]
MKRRSVPLFFSALLACSPPVQAQQPARGADPSSAAPPAPAANDPFIKGNSAPAGDAQEQDSGVKEGLIRIEYFSMPPATARKVLRQFPKQDDLYAWLGTQLENENGEVKLERLCLLKVRGGQRSKLEEIDEYPYPTEFDPPQIPQTFGMGINVDPAPIHVTSPAPPPAPKPAPPNPAPNSSPVPAPAPTPTPMPPQGAKGEAGSAGPAGAPAILAPGAVPARVFPPWPYTSTTPSSFAFRNTGWSHEIEMTFGDDGSTVDLNIAPEVVRLTGLDVINQAGDIVQP